MPNSMYDKNKYQYANIALDYIWYLHGTDTIKTIAEERNITRERVRQSIKKAYMKWNNNNYE